VSKRDYEEIARVLAGDYALHPQVVRGITLSLADLFKRDNPHFDRDRFYKAVFGA